MSSRFHQSSFDASNQPEDESKNKQRPVYRIANRLVQLMAIAFAGRILFSLIYSNSPQTHGSGKPSILNDIPKSQGLRGVGAPSHVDGFAPVAVQRTEAPQGSGQPSIGLNDTPKSKGLHGQQEEEFLDEVASAMKEEEEDNDEEEDGYPKEESEITEEDHSDPDDSGDGDPALGDSDSEDQAEYADEELDGSETEGSARDNDEDASTPSDDGADAGNSAGNVFELDAAGNHAEPAAWESKSVANSETVEIKKEKTPSSATAPRPPPPVPPPQEKSGSKPDSEAHTAETPQAKPEKVVEEVVAKTQRTDLVSPNDTEAFVKMAQDAAARHIAGEVPEVSKQGSTATADAMHMHPLGDFTKKLQDFLGPHVSVEPYNTSNPAVLTGQVLRYPMFKMAMPRMLNPEHNQWFLDGGIPCQKKKDGSPQDDSRYRCDYDDFKEWGQITKRVCRGSTPPAVCDGLRDHEVVMTGEGWQWRFTTGTLEVLKPASSKDVHEALVMAMCQDSGVIWNGKGSGPGWVRAVRSGLESLGNNLNDSYSRPLHIAVPLLYSYQPHSFQHFTDTTLMKAVQTSPLVDMQSNPQSQQGAGYHGEFILQGSSAVNAMLEGLGGGKKTAASESWQHSGAYDAVAVPCRAPEHPILFQRAAEAFGVKTNWKPIKERKRILWAGRGGSRGVVNEDDAFKALEIVAQKRGFVIEHMKHPPMQAPNLTKHFSDVRVLIGPHGGALYNIQFMPPGSSVIGLATKTNWYYFWNHQASFLGIDLWRSHAEGVGSNDNWYSNHDQKMRANITDVEMTLAHILDGPPPLDNFEAYHRQF